MTTDPNSTKKLGTPQKWCDEIRQAQKREKNFRTLGKSVVEIYEAGKEDEVEFNILYSNTETLLPALYNTTPRPVVQRRYRDSDPLGSAVAKTTQRALEFSIDPAGEETLDFDQVMEAATLSALLPGRGLTRFDLDVELEEGGNADPSAGTAHSYICVKDVPWDRFCHGYGRKWADVEWVCFEHLVSEHERDENFPELGVQEKKDWEPVEMEDRTGNSSDTSPHNDEELKGAKLYQFFEIWHRPSKTVMFCTPQLEEWLRVVDDPFKLEGFYPLPACGPLTFVSRLSGIVPVPLYKFYKKQAEELNTITLRIKHLTKMLKVRGAYDSTVTGLAEVLKASDGEMIPLDALSGLYGQNKSLKDALWVPEIQEIIQALQTLYINRDACKRTIYEITGISDILRGASVASETATAQKIKDQWGTLRLRKMQKKVQTYVRDSLRVMAELVAGFYSVEELQRITNLEFPTAEAQAQARLALQSSQAPGGQPDPQIVEILQTPSWEAVKQAMASHLSRAYKIDIETNSTVDAEATEDKQNISELLNAMAQFMSGVAPLVEQGAMPYDVAKTILLTIVRRYRFGTEVEDALQKMQAPQPKDDGSQAKLELEKQKGEAQIQQMQVQAQIDERNALREQQLRDQEAALKARELAMQEEYLTKQHELRMAELQAKTQATLVTAQAKVAAAHAMPKKPQPSGKPKKD